MCVYIYIPIYTYVCIYSSSKLKFARMVISQKVLVLRDFFYRILEKAMYLM